MEESRTVRYGTMPRDGNPSVGATRLTSPVHFFTVPPTPHSGIGTKRLSIIQGPLVINRSGTPRNSKLPLVNVLQRIEVLNPFAVRYLVANL